MGLTVSSGGRRAASFIRDGQLDPKTALVVMAGNPNVGKSSLFNALTGLHQHTGNWTGKTVGCTVGVLKSCRRRRARGSDDRKNPGEGTAGKRFPRKPDKSPCPILLADLPGCYSLCPRSAEEQAALDFLLTQPVRAAVVVCDAQNLGRNLLLALQMTAILPRERIILCVNLADEAAREGVFIEKEELAKASGFPVVLTSARTGEGLGELEEAIRHHSAEAADKEPPCREEPVIQPAHLFLDEAAHLAKVGIRNGQPKVGTSGQRLTERIDRVVMGRYTAIPVALLFLSLTLWITIYAANKPSELLSLGLNQLEKLLRRLPLWDVLPAFVSGILLDGVYRTVAWVVSVMLPPMAIFFPLFTLLEDLGFLPRIAFNFDRSFQSCAACGKQALTMCMGLGCCAAGVTGCRIIDSPRERMIAVLTNAFMPCNGKFPTLLCMSAVMLTIAGGTWADGAAGSLCASLLITGAIVLCVLVTLGVSRLLSFTLLRGTPSSFLLELPPYRVPKLGQVLVRSLLDRTLFVLGRAVTVAAPAGAILWLTTHITVSGDSLLTLAARSLDPIGMLLCVDGAVLLALILSAPANELTLPILLMIYAAGTEMVGSTTAAELSVALGGAGWSVVTCTAFLLLFLFHAPCTTTVLTIRKETGKWRWALAGAVIPASVGVLLCGLLRLGTVCFG